MICKKVSEILVEAFLNILRIYSEEFPSPKFCQEFGRNPQNAWDLPCSQGPKYSWESFRTRVVLRTYYVSL